MGYRRDKERNRRLKNFTTKPKTVAKQVLTITQRKSVISSILPVTLRGVPSICAGFPIAE